MILDLKIYFVYSILWEVNILKPRIVIITSHYLHQRTKESLERLNLDYDITLTVYDNFEQIPEVYDKYAELADGFLVSGNVAKRAIEAAPHKYKKPIVPFEIDGAGLYKFILNLILNHREQDADRIILDFLIPTGIGITVRDLLAYAETDFLLNKVTGWMEHSDIINFGNIEDFITNNTIELWNLNRFDCIICQYTNLIPTLEAKGIPCICPPLPDFHLKSMIDNLVDKINLEEMRANLPAVICVCPCKVSLLSEENLLQLETQINQFLKDYFLDCIVNRSNTYYNILTTAKIVQQLTNDYKNCILSAYIKKNVDFPCAVGYGIGINLNNAVINAHVAARESAFAGYSFIKNSDGELIGPLNFNYEESMESLFIKDVGKIAKQCKLSTSTILKLFCFIKLNQTNKLTSQEVSSKLDMSVRNANRILSNLEKGGYAQIVYTQTNNGNGRPGKVYEIDFDKA